MIPRWVVYTQGGLLGVIAISFFVFGLAVGSGYSVGSTGPTTRQIAEVSGLVLYEDNGRRVDTGAVVMFLPSDGTLDPRPEPDSLLPDRFIPLDNPAIDAIREIGGAVVRADRVGGFATRLRQGTYYMLVLSKHQTQANSSAIEKQMRADLGAFFFPVDDLIGQSAWHWKKIEVGGDKLDLGTIQF